MSIIEQLQIIDQCGKEEIQHILAWVGLASVSVAFGAMLLPYASKFFKFLSRVYNDLYGKWTRLHRLDKVIAALFVCLMTQYAATKPGRPANVDSDDSITLYDLTYETTNIVVSASVTNTYTMVDVYYGTGVTQSTPVQVRMSQTNEWEELVKLNPFNFNDAAVTNTLHFSSEGDYSAYPYWYVGSNPPGIIIEVTGITLTRFVASSQAVQIEWTCDDARATAFDISYRNGNTGEWTDLVTTTATNAVIQGFFINRTTQWRVSSTFEEGN